MDSAVDYFLSNYFHQDFNQEFGDKWGALDAFIRLDSELAPALPDGIDGLLTAHPTEPELGDYLDVLGCEFRPDESDGGYRGWLTEVARRVREATNT